MITGMEIVGALFGAVVIATVTYSRAIHGKPNLHRLLLGVCLLIAVGSMATSDVGSLRWGVGALGWAAALVALALSADLRNTP